MKKSIVSLVCLCLKSPQMEMGSPLEAPILMDAVEIDFMGESFQDYS